MEVEKSFIGKRCPGVFSMLILVGLFSLVALNGSAYADYTISMTSSGAQSLDVLPDGTSNINTSISEDAISITTTCPSGYNLGISTSVNDNNLYLNGSNSNNASGTYIAPSNGTTPLNNAANTWGYYFNNSSSTAPTPASVFSAVPTTNTLIKTSSNTSDSFSIYYGAAVNSSLSPGTYKMIPGSNNTNGTIVYYLTMNQSCLQPKIYMQDITEDQLAEMLPHSGDSTTLYDKRDDSDYQIANVNGSFWMAQNLRITNTTGQPVGTILAQDSNFSSNITFDGDLTLGNSYTAKRYHVPTTEDLSTIGLTKDEVGTWYNLCAASAGTNCDNTTTSTVAQDICPAGWKLPTSDDINGIINYSSAFSPRLSGYYQTGALGANIYGYWWSTDSSNGTTWVTFRWAASALSARTSNKRNGLSVRCIKKTAGTGLYDAVAAQSKGTQTLANLKTVLTDSNSGVYEYDASAFGTASDAANTSKIYYYRGILDNTTGTYGSDGDNAKYPNTVVLSTANDKSGLTTNDTCWRIIRTTGSGGVKMIYQGNWTANGASGNCKNVKASPTYVAKTYYNRRSTSSSNDYDTEGRIVYVGYSFSSNSSMQTSSTSTSNATLFETGTNKSNARTTVENWYSSNLSNYTSKLETSAGYCNDRTTYSGTQSSTQTTSNKPYSTSNSDSITFGPAVRFTHQSATDMPITLTCSQTRDILTTSNGLTYPTALITADEVVFAGLGGDNEAEGNDYGYNSHTYLEDNSSMWTLSPGMRYNTGTLIKTRDIDVCTALGESGINCAGGVSSDSHSVRPTISLVSGTTAVSGTGTATDPWIVNP